MRTATISRKTSETSIDVTVNLDGTGAYTVSTGIGFFDHMLEQLSRHSLIDLDVKTVGDLHIDLMARKAWRDGRRLDLTAKEFALLAALARRHGEILSKTTIAELVWGVNFDSDVNVVEVAIKRLRSKIDGPFATPLLHTIRGMGYVLEVRESSEHA